MNMKEKLESLGKNSIAAENCQEKKHTSWAPPASAESRMCPRTSFGLLMRTRAMTMW